jgi:hypothetical protein
MSRNAVPAPPADSQPGRSDRHTLIAREHGEVVLRVHYAEPHRIEVTGRFYPSRADEPILISPTKGIHWKGGGVPAGATLDLRPQGRGTIDFERTGLIRILPR